MTGRALTVRQAGRVTVAAAPAEIDTLNVAQVRYELTALIEARPPVVVLDLTATTFCDSAGVATLVRLAKEAAAAQVGWRLAVSGPVLRVIELLGADHVLEVYPALDAALNGDQGGRAS